MKLEAFESLQRLLKFKQEALMALMETQPTPRQVQTIRDDIQWIKGLMTGANRVKNP